MKGDERYPAVPVHVLLRVPTGSTKAFMLAAAGGRSMNPRGNFDDLRRGERPIGVRVSNIHRDRVKAALGIGLRQWQHAVRDWKQEGLVHGCENGRIFLTFERTTPDVCPDCQGRFDFVSTRSGVDLDAKSGEPVHVQNGETSTGRGKGDAVLTPERIAQLAETYGTSAAPSEEAMGATG